MCKIADRSYLCAEYQRKKKYHNCKIKMDRDINRARGIMLQTLLDGALHLQAGNNSFIIDNKIHPGNM